MEGLGDQVGGNGDDLTGKKRPKLQTLRSKLFGKMKRKGDEGVMKHTQSACDITQGSLDLDVDFHSSQNILGSRSLSHDSIFLADQCQSDPEPPRVFSQENIHGKIRTLQLKLQQQNMHLGPPPMVLPIKRVGGEPEADEPPQSPSEISGLTKSLSCKPPTQQAPPQPPSPRRVPLPPTVPCPGVDFSTPPKFILCLDSSAARHRMSIKPPNQRASTKSRRLPTPITLTGEGLTAPPTRNPRPASPGNTLTGAADENFTHAVSQPEGATSPSTACLPQPMVKQQTLAWEAACTWKPEFTESSTSAVWSKQAPKLVEAMTGKLPSSALSTSMKGGEDHREIQLGFRVKSVQHGATFTVGSPSTPCRIPVESEKNQLQSEKATQEKDALNKNGVHDISREDHPGGQSQGWAVGVALRPPSHRRNTAPLDGKADSRNLQPVFTVPPTGQVDKLPKEFTNQPRSVSGSLRLAASPAKSYERHRTASFTGVLEQAGSKRELPPPPMYSKTLKTQDQLRSTQLQPKGREPCANLSDSLGNDVPAVPTTPRDLTPTRSAGREREDSEACETQEESVQGTEVQETAETIDEAKNYSKGNDIKEEGKAEEGMNAFGVKLRTTSLSLKCSPGKTQSELNVKQQKAEVSTSTPAWVPESPAVGGHKDSSVSPARGNLAATVLKTSFTPKTEPLISTKALSTAPEGDSRVQESTIPIRTADLGRPVQPSSSPAKEIKTVHSWAPKESTPVPLTPNEGTPGPLTPNEGTPGPLTPKEGTSFCMLKNTPTPPAVKEPREPSSELSWMSMAREKTRSLQQLFTSRLPDFPGLQSTARPTNVASAPPQAQTSTLQCSGGSGRSTHQVSPAQQVVRPLQAISTSPPAMQASAKATDTSITQASPMEYSIRPPQPIKESDLSLMQTLSTTGQTQLSGTAVQSFASISSTTYSTTKPVRSTAAFTSPGQINTQTVHRAEEAPFHLPLYQAYPVQSVTNPQEFQATTLLNLRSTQPASLRLSLSPKLAPHQTSAETRARVGRDGPSMLLGKADLTPVLHEKGPVGSRAQCAGILGSKAFPSEQTARPTSDPAKIEHQKVALEYRSPTQPLTAFRTMPSHSKFTEASSGPMGLNREEKWPRITTSSSPPSSSSPPQSISDGGQPSWMELAKRKSLAWSDKTMD
ncbi:nascent polypeptide-associated complex subunit alpha, muscle-specific form [Electrophorus electricus]|uniref:nascent polypeptide-associated complex subunit alpha, muscle-specific form n=1 Tax=Electrophorus electricus TaxID=8005 RepID=UPI0015D073D2|nr:nascent polypeptide-associated complex subunit alpha, muscle-specific form [Electrophorus electricus]